MVHLVAQLLFKTSIWSVCVFFYFGKPAKAACTHPQTSADWDVYLHFPTLYKLKEVLFVPQDCNELLWWITAKWTAETRLTCVQVHTQEHTHSEAITPTYCPSVEWSVGVDGNSVVLCLQRNNQEDQNQWETHKKTECNVVIALMELKKGSNQV